jgi:hypothetical protein
MNKRIVIRSSLFSHLTSRVLILVSCILLLTNCKVNYSMSGASISPDIKTFAVRYFQKTSALGPPTLSQTFTEKLKDKFLSQTTLRLAEKGPDLIFEGAITNYAVTPLAIQANETAAQNRLTINITVKFTNLKNEKQNFETTFSRFADYSSSKALSVVENDLIAEITDQLVEDVFNKAFINW